MAEREVVCNGESWCVCVCVFSMLISEKNSNKRLFYLMPRPFILLLACVSPIDYLIVYIAPLMSEIVIVCKSVAFRNLLFLTSCQLPNTTVASPGCLIKILLMFSVKLYFV